MNSRIFWGTLARQCFLVNEKERTSSIVFVLSFVCGIFLNGYVLLRKAFYND